MCWPGSGEAGVRGPTPEGDTGQRFAICGAPFLRLELGCARVCVCWSGGDRVRRPAPEGDTDKQFAVQSAMCVWVWRGWIKILQIKVEISQNKLVILQNQSRDLTKQSQDLAN